MHGHQHGHYGRHGESRREHWAAGRHHRRRFGGFGFGGRHGGGRGDMNPDDMRAGRMLAQGDLRLVALALIAEAPRHGYEIIKLVEEKTADWYSPSPGIVYPTLTYLEEAGYVTAASRRLEKALHHHRRRPRLSRNQSRSRRRRARPTDRARRTRQSLAPRRPRRAWRAKEPAAPGRGRTRSSARNCRLSDSKTMPKRRLVSLKSSPAPTRNCGGEAETAQDQRVAISGVCTCSGRIPTPSSRAGMRRSTGKMLNSLKNSGGFGRCWPVMPSTRLMTRF